MLILDINKILLISSASIQHLVALLVVPVVHIECCSREHCMNLNAIEVNLYAVPFLCRYTVCHSPSTQICMPGVFIFNEFALSSIATKQFIILGQTNDSTVKTLPLYLKPAHTLDWVCRTELTHTFCSNHHKYDIYAYQEMSLPRLINSSTMLCMNV